jgi:hypothetical protein
VRATWSPTLLVLALTAWVVPSRAAPDGDGEQRLTIHLALSTRPHGTEAERDRIRLMEEELLGLLAASDAGRLARDAWPEGACRITIETRDARLAWEVVAEAVRAIGPRPGSHVLLRMGGPGAPEERVDLALRQARGERAAPTPPR